MRALLLAVCFCAAVRAEVVLAPPFQDHAVLQRDRPIPVWGRAAPHEIVRVSFADSAAVQATTGTDGRWRVDLPARPASSQSAEFVVEGTNRIVVRNVLVGEVWLCSGQSNMEFRLQMAVGADADIAGAELPQIRQFKIARSPAEQPRETVSSAWTVCTPATAGNFTAVGFYFARDLGEKLGVPIGIINSSHGASPIESWLGAGALASAPEFAVVARRWADVVSRYPAAKTKYDAALARWETAAAGARNDGTAIPRKPSPPAGPGHYLEPSSLYNGMIHPLVPYSIRGFLWYQGEANARRCAEYERLFTTLIRQWRRDFQQENAPFFWVQLPSLGRMPLATTTDDWVALRAAQSAALALPSTGQAITIDVGDPTNIHPTRKREVGERLARIARRQVYGEAIEDRGPEPVEVTLAADGALRLRFAHTTGGLELRGDAVSAFEVAEEDGRFVSASSVALEGADGLVVKTEGGARPTAVRYAWHADPPATLFNRDGMPAAPFQAAVR